MKPNPLFDIDFLNKLTLRRDRITYAKITALTKDELPIESIEGKVTGGSVNIDGASAVRRTCSITMVAKDVDINAFYWGLKNKFTLEIGIQNFIDKRYPDIIWFKQGLFIITAFNTSQSANNYTINISGKDKMCLLNGEVGGTLFHETDFGIEEIVDLQTNTTTRNEIPLKTIIKEAVQTFGGEPPQNIIINDLDDIGLEVVEYRGEVPLYLKRKTTDGDIKNFINMTLDGEQACYAGEIKTIISDKNNINYDSLTNMVDYTPTEIFSVDANDNKTRFSYYIAKLDYGTVAGYRSTDLVYPGDLISNIGESLTSMLDKIKNVLGNFEYFYDINGKFVFQKKRNYIISPWGGQEDSGEVKMEIDNNTNNQIFNFTNGALISSFGNTPNLLNLRNDFAVWGKYNTASGEQIPIHMRYAVDKKPESYKPMRPLKQVLKHYINGELVSEEAKYYDAFDIIPYNDDNYIEAQEFGDVYYLGNDLHQINTHTYYAKEPYSIKNGCDWRELIYQMALDYRKLYHDDDFVYNLQKTNPNCLNGKTGYEQYYIDLEGFWRELYNPNPKGSYIEITEEDIIKAHSENNLYLSSFKKYDKSKIDLKETIDYDKFYIVHNAKHVSDQGVETFYKSIYPFIEGFCHLDKNVIYYIQDQDKQKRPILGEEDLLEKNIKDIYIDVNGDMISFVEYRFKNALNDANIDFYIEEEYLSYQELDSNLSDLYKDFPDELMRLKLNIFGENKDLKLVSTLAISYYNKEFDYYTSDDSNLLYWNKNLVESPESLIFWFDFLDPTGTDIEKYGVRTIGSRPKAINDDKVKSIYYREIPNVIFTSSINEEVKKSGYAYIQIQPTMENLFNISSKGKSAKEMIDDLLYQHLYCTESFNISTVPVYHLEPNSRVFIQDSNSKIQGEYLINKITIPLAYNGMMTLNGVKVPPDAITG